MRADGSARRTLADQATADLRRAVLTGSFAPGSPLRPAALSQPLGVSSTVVREALTRLAREHIVVADPHRGFRVRDLSLEDLRDLSRVRIEVESLALRWSIAAGDLDWEGQVVAALHRYAATVQRAAGDTDRADELGRAHEELHLAFVSACGSSHLLDIRAGLFGAAELYRRWTRYRKDVDRDVGAEHRAIADACLDRDVERAVALMTEHIDRTTQLVLAHLEPTV